LAAIRNVVRWTGAAIAAPVLFVIGFLLASYVGAAIPRGAQIAPAASAQSPGGDAIRIYLLTSPLHTDIALPARAPGMERFSVLRDGGIPLDNPNLHYIGFGWGSKAFYTTAGTYSDIELSAVFKAVFGDTSVMRVVALGELAPAPNVLAFDLTPGGFAALLVGISASFQGGEPSRWQHLAGASIGSGDAFYEANGNFNLLIPCNQWTGRLLSRAGVTTGIWTPTTHSLTASIDWHN
jgi:uncharacterized protein (TIGR02117 family)